MRDDESDDDDDDDDYDDDDDNSYNQDIVENGGRGKSLSATKLKESFVFLCDCVQTCTGGS